MNEVSETVQLDITSRACFAEKIEVAGDTQLETTVSLAQCFL